MVLLHECQRRFGNLQPTAVDRQRVAAVFHLDDLGRRGVFFLKLCCVMSPPKECPMIAGAFFNLRITSLKWSRICLTLFVREDLGMQVGLLDRFEIVRPIRCQGRIPVFFEEPSPAIPAARQEPEAMDEYDGLVRRFHDVRTVIERAHEIERGAVREAIALAADQLLRNEDLSRLRDDVPLPVGPTAKPLDLNAIARLRELFAELEFKSLVSRLDPIEERLRTEANG
jgi:hypothetical protein